METLTTTTTLTTDQANAAAVGAAVGGIFGAIFVCILIFYIFTVIAAWKIFEKAGERGWKALIPIYNFYIMFKIVNMKGWFWFVLIVSIIASIIVSATGAPNIYIVNETEIQAYNFGANPAAVVALIIEGVVTVWASIMFDWRLSKVFGHGAGYFIGLLFLPNIFWLILGFDKSKYHKKALQH